MEPVATAGKAALPGLNVEDGHDELRAQVRAHFAAAIASGAPLFVTNAGDLWQTYLEAIPDPLRQSMNCSACRKFIQRYGSLVTIDDKGAPRPRCGRKRRRPTLPRRADACGRRLPRPRSRGLLVECSRAGQAADRRVAALLAEPAEPAAVELAGQDGGSGNGREARGARDAGAGAARVPARRGAQGA